MTRYFYDTEFIEDGRTIDLVSIGIVCEDGREYYAVNGDLPSPRFWRHDWIMANVWPSLPKAVERVKYVTSSGKTVTQEVLDRNHPDVKERSTIADEVRDFLLFEDGKPELWAWYAAYDHVALCQLWGAMVNLPKGIPMYTRDLKQECDRLGNPPLPEQSAGEHNALADARHNAVRARALRNYVPS